jgi:hypothetical protein
VRLVDQVRAFARELGENDDGLDARLDRAVLRYVLDRHASFACAELIRSGDGLFDPSSEIFRMPAASFWFEAYHEASLTNPNDPIMRFGLLVECADDCRSGTVTHFSEVRGGGCQRLLSTTEFDLDAPPARSGPDFRFDQEELPHLKGLLDHTLIRPVAEAGLPRDATRDQVLQRNRILALATWFDVPMIFAFVAMLNSPNIVETRQSDLHVLNAARLRRRRPALLEHIEVRMVLGTSGQHPSSAQSGIRVPPRLHHVRGHFMHRAGKAIWRSPHLRGDTARAALTRTVRVTAHR